jgi:3-deoxy-D-manno-octulosonate 8-phosphate phosphatase (KDO 8-P phosphatase)
MAVSLEELHARARRLRLILLDVDGVLTDGTVAIHSAGGEAKSFHIRDGAAIVWAGREDLEIGFLSGRPSAATSRRASELGVKLVFQTGPDKVRSYVEILAARQFEDDQVAYMADDLLDLAVLDRVGLSAAPADAAAEVRARVHWVSAHPGGRGAVRELLELVLRAQGKWDRIVQGFLTN